MPDPSTQAEASSRSHSGQAERSKYADVFGVLFAVAAVGAVWAGGCFLLTPVWTLAVRNLGTVPCTVVVTFDSEDGDRLEFRDVPVEPGYEKFELVRRRSSATIHSIRLVRGDGQEKLIQLDQRMSSGQAFVMDFDARLETDTEFDADAHM